MFSWSEVLTWDELWAWSEVWALLIPLAALYYRRKRIEANLKPVIIYLYVAFFLNLLCDFTWRFQLRLNLPEWMRNNSALYNLHAIARLLLFSWFFIRLHQMFLVTIKKSIPFLFLAFVITNFLVLKRPASFYTGFNSELHAADAALLLFYCIQYYIYLSLREQTISVIERSVNWIIAGLTIYVTFNFFIFLFFSILVKASVDFANILWEVHNISYIVFCSFIAKGIYEQRG